MNTDNEIGRPEGKEIEGATLLQVGENVRTIGECKTENGGSFTARDEVCERQSEESYVGFQKFRSIEKQESFVPTAPHISSSTTRQSAWLRKSTVIRDASATGPRDTMRKSRLGKLSSRARMVLGSIVDIKANIFGDTHDKKVARYMNTYRLEPDNPFNPEKVDKILREVLTEALENLTYDPEKCVAQAKWASMAIRSKVKALDFDRYKLVCIATIGEKISQDVYTTCRFLWDAEKDRYSFYSMENAHVFGIAYCFGVYFE